MLTRRNRIVTVTLFALVVGALSACSDGDQVAPQTAKPAASTSTRATVPTPPSGTPVRIAPTPGTLTPGDWYINKEVTSGTYAGTVPATSAICGIRILNAQGQPMMDYTKLGSAGERIIVTVPADGTIVSVTDCGTLVKS